MAEFRGSKREFHRFIGPFLRNSVQNFTRKIKRAAGTCQHCGETGVLEAAHAHGRRRTDLIDLILNQYKADQEFHVDLCAFLRSFKDEHNSSDNAIIPLCKRCHTAYDKRDSSRRNINPVSPHDSIHENDLHQTRGVLPINLEPADSSEFLTRLMRVGEAEIQVNFFDGTTMFKKWVPVKISAASNIIGNLRSRPEFRKGTWEKNGISSVVVRVREP